MTWRRNKDHDRRLSPGIPKKMYAFGDILFGYRNSFEHLSFSCVERCWSSCNVERLAMKRFGVFCFIAHESFYQKEWPAFGYFPNLGEFIFYSWEFSGIWKISSAKLRAKGYARPAPKILFSKTTNFPLNEKGQKPELQKTQSRRPIFSFGFSGWFLTFSCTKCGKCIWK